MEDKRGQKGASAGACRVRKCFSGFTRFSLRIQPVSQRGARRCVPMSVTVLTALTIHLFKVEKFSVAFLRVSPRAFSPRRFLR